MTTIKDDFIVKWYNYFKNADLPVVAFYHDDPPAADIVPPADGWNCVIAHLQRIRKGTNLAFDIAALGCGGAQKYCGFSDYRPGIEQFLSSGVPGQMEGERYKKSPETVRALFTRMDEFEASAQYIVFKRWDMMEDDDRPEVVIFMDTPDVLSGVFTLAGYEEEEVQAVIAPFASGCAAVVMFPFQQCRSEHPKAVLGMFDVSARPFVPENTLSLAIPYSKFTRMVADMDESFLITESWKKVQKRIAAARQTT